MTKTSKSVKPDWLRDEVILLLDLYLRHGALGKTDPKVQELSQLLKGLPLHANSENSAKFRNPTGIEKKLKNLAALDPSHNGRGLQNGSKMDQKVWNEFHDQPELVAKLAKAIKKVSLLDEAGAFEEGENEADEGKILFRIHRSRERNQKLVTKRKFQRRNETGGALTCEVCGFDFSVAYGERGDGFAECHHKTPLAESGSVKTKIDDLAVLCANCHRMIHVRKPTLSVELLREIMNSAE